MNFKKKGFQLVVGYGGFLAVLYFLLSSTGCAVAGAGTQGFVTINPRVEYVRSEPGSCEDLRAARAQIQDRLRELKVEIEQMPACAQRDIRVVQGAVLFQFDKRLRGYERERCGVQS